eukprot:scaffold11635_cov61-Phaeocystis_antarctica.AAC.4
MIRFHALHDLRRYIHNTAMLNPSHPDTNVRCSAMMIRPCKTRDSTRSALQTAVRNAKIRPCLAPPGRVRPCSPLTGAAEYAWGARARRHKDRR